MDSVKIEDRMNQRGARNVDAAGEPEQQASLLGTPGPVRDAGAPRSLAGQSVGRYRLLFPIASGGMAEVWAGKPEGAGLSRTVAVKLVRPEYSADEEYSRMFIDEAMVASSIHHPNICATYDLGREGSLLFMILEWVAGDSLTGLLQGGSEMNPLPDEIAARVCSEACAGLHAAHEAVDPDGHLLGIVHRDVSPPNILLSIHGQVKVSDFGIAKARNQLHSRTRTGELKGKLAYIPPEQIFGHGVDRRSDVYAMGCVLYIATLGLRPFGSGPKALGKIAGGLYKKPRELRADYPEGLEAIVVRALAVKPEDRYQTAEEMRYDLEQWLLTRPRLVGHADVARLVRERITPDRRKMIDALLSSSRALPEALAYQFLQQQERTTTPTATSGVVVQPAGFASLTPSVLALPAAPDPDQEEDVTRLAPRSVVANIVPEPARPSPDAVPTVAPPRRAPDAARLAAGLTSPMPPQPPRCYAR